MAVLKKIREFGKRNDKPYPSYLLFLEDNYLYAVCAVAEKKIYIITAYYP